MDPAPTPRPFQTKETENSYLKGGNRSRLREMNVAKESRLLGIEAYIDSVG